MGGHKPGVLRSEHRDWLLERAGRDLTLRGLVAELAACGVRVDYRQVWAFVHAEVLISKKSVLPAEQLRLKVARRHEQCKKCQNRLDPRRPVFIDETWQRIGSLLDTFTPEGCQNYLVNAGYASV